MQETHLSQITLSCVSLLPTLSENNNNIDNSSVVIIIIIFVIITAIAIVIMAVVVILMILTISVLVISEPKLWGTYGIMGRREKS